MYQNWLRKEDNGEAIKLYMANMKVDKQAHIPG